MKTTTIGVFEDHHKMDLIVSELRTAGISDSEISCLYTDKDGYTQDAQTGEKVGSGAVAGVTTGAVVGAIAGLVVANGILPGIGTLFVAGPLVSILGLTGAVATTAAGAATGAVAGGIVGAFVNLGVSDEDAKIYENHLRIGKVVVVTRTTQHIAKDILSRHGATDIREYMEV